MKALVLVEYNRFEYKEVAKPEAGPGEVLIAVEAVDAMVSTTAPLAEGAGWFERLYRGEPGLMKVILTP